MQTQQSNSDGTTACRVNKDESDRVYEHRLDIISCNPAQEIREKLITE